MDIPKRRVIAEHSEPEPIEMWIYDERVLAQAVIADLGGVARYQGRWYVLDKARDVWRMCEDESVVASAIMDVIERTVMVSTKTVAEQDIKVKKPLARRASVVASILQVLLWTDGVRRDGPELPRGYVALADGMMHLQTRECEPYRGRFVPKRIALTMAEAMAARNKPPVMWESFLREGFDDNTYQLVQEFIGYVLMPDQPFQKALWIYGRPGCGKSTIISIVKRLVGEGNYWSGKASDLSSKYIGAQMLNKQFITIPDFRANREANRGLEWILGVIGGDDVTVEDKYEKAFSAAVLGKTMIGSNELQSFPDSTGAVARRLITVQRGMRKSEDEDSFLEPRLASELGSILHWACDGLNALLTRGRFNKALVDTKLQEHATAASNNVFAWAQERVEWSPIDTDHNGRRRSKFFTPMVELFDDYRKWCEAANIKLVKTRHEFIVNLKQTFGDRIVLDRGMSGGVQHRGAYGLKVLDDDGDVNTEET
jgi:P4 family phage/plasmid primase-like protien